MEYITLIDVEVRETPNKNGVTTFGSARHTT